MARTAGEEEEGNIIEIRKRKKRTENSIANTFRHIAKVEIGLSKYVGI